MIDVGARQLRAPNPAGARDQVDGAKPIERKLEGHCIASRYPPRDRERLGQLGPRLWVGEL